MDHSTAAQYSIHPFSTTYPKMPRLPWSQSLPQGAHRPAEKHRPHCTRLLGFEVGPHCQFGLSPSPNPGSGSRMGPWLRRTGQCHGPCFITYHRGFETVLGLVCHLGPVWHRGQHQGHKASGNIVPRIIRALTMVGWQFKRECSTIFRWGLPSCGSPP